mmetsp:Transcript_9796/g.19885  ORF Transcript_9796/g.19885 Transcript_9796/m.19885 type:complete len:334 (-) Transcript_9796:1714-2715(-)
MSDDNMSISDLLPLVAAALNDQAAADAAKELAVAREERDTSHKVEVLRAINDGDDENEDGETIVYGSALFEDGQYASNTNLWNVTLEQNSNNICRLADLRDCHICVGGGFPMATLDDTDSSNPFFEGWINGEDRRQGISGDACEVSFCFCPHTIWLVILIHGWPREAWEAVIQEDDYDQDDQHVVLFLVENVAEQYPDATVEFKKVTFAIRSIHGALKRLLSSKRKEVVRADRDRRMAERNWQEVVEFVESYLQARGILSEHHQTRMILGILWIKGFKTRTEANDDVILRFIAACEQSPGVFDSDDEREVFTTVMQYFREQSGSDQDDHMEES